MSAFIKNTTQPYMESSQTPTALTTTALVSIQDCLLIGPEVSQLACLHPDRTFQVAGVRCIRHLST